MPSTFREPSISAVTTGDYPARLRCVPALAEPQALTARPTASGRARHAAGMELALQRWLAAHCIMFLRVSLGAVFLAFGFLKFFPGVSPAENLAVTTTSILTFHLVPGSVELALIATLECSIGLWLLSGRALRGVICLLAVELVGIMSPVVLLAGRLFDGPHGAPTLEGQYVLKDVILVGAVLVLAATILGPRDGSAVQGGAS